MRESGFRADWPCLCPLLTCALFSSGWLYARLSHFLLYFCSERVITPGWNCDHVVSLRNLRPPVFVFHPVQLAFIFLSHLALKWINGLLAL